VNTNFSSEETNLETLNAYPCARKLFIKYNTAIPSRMSVERSFSVGKKILTYQRTKLTD